jgi:two-component system response regulator FixJ
MREQEVLSCVVTGLSNKEMARQLGISPRTIEVHRARIIEKAGAKNTADLIRLAMS